MKDEILAQAMVFFIAGYDTTATTLHFLFWHFALEQETQEKVVEEIKDVIGDDVSIYKVTALQNL